jgi:hypothetical protein
MLATSVLMWSQLVLQRIEDWFIEVRYFVVRVYRQKWRYGQLIAC